MTQRIAYRRLLEQQRTNVRNNEIAEDIWRKRTLGKCLHLWQRLRQGSNAKKRAALPRIQSIVRGWLVRRWWLANRDLLRKEHHVVARYRQLLMTRIFRHWHHMIIQRHRWHHKMTPMLNRWTRSRLHLHLGQPFPARQWFTRDGKHVMAEEYYKWRLRQVALVKWMLFLAYR
jgi:hypothetical protein